MFDPFDEEWLERLGIPRTYFKLKTKEYRYWFLALYEKLYSVFDINNMPEEWPPELIKYLLFGSGKFAVFNTEQWGTIATLVTSMGGFNTYWEQTKIGVATPLYTNILTLHKDVEIVYIRPNKHGLYDVIDQTATKLAELTKSIQIGIVNSKLPFIAHATNKAESELIKAVYDQIQQGETLIVPKTKAGTGEVLPHKELFSTWVQDFSKTYIVTELLDNFEKIMNQFYMEIGLVPQLSDSKAHTLNAEMGAQEDMSQARARTWKSCLEFSIDKVNKLFGMNLEVEMHAQSDIKENGDILAQQEQANK